MGEYYDTGEQVVESDSPLTDEQQEVYEILKKKQEIHAIAAKKRSADENKKLAQYRYELKKFESKIIEDLLEKCPALRKQTKTGGQRMSALRSCQDEQQKNEEYYDTGEQVVESDSHLTKEQQEVYEILKKKQEILAIAAKKRSTDENKKLVQYRNELQKFESKIIKDLLEKCPALRKQTKTGGQRISALRSCQDEQQKNEDRL